MKIKRKLLAFLMMFAMVFSMMPGLAMADTTTDATVYVSISKYGQFVDDKDGNDVAMVPVKLTGQNAYTLDDALEAVHDTYYEGGSATGYSVSDTDYGLSLDKMWGDTSGMFGYQINNGTVTVYNLEQAVEDGDRIDAYINQSSYPDNEGYAYFDVNNAEIKAGESVSLTLKYASGYDTSWNTVYSPCEGAVITLNGTAQSVTTDAEGKATVKFSKAGEYVVSATKTKTVGENDVTAITAPVCKVTVLPDATFTVPSNAKLTVGTISKYYVFTEVQPTEVRTDKTAGTSTYYYNLTNNKGYAYRVEGDNYITNIGYVTKKANTAVEINVTQAQLQPEGKTTKTVDRVYSNNNGSNVADVFLNINSQGYLKLDKAGDTYQIVNLRCWQPVGNTSSNYYLEPDYHYTVVNENGKASNDVVTVDENGKLTAVGKGTAIVLVTYDSMIADYGSGNAYSGFYGAIWPENTGVFVVSVGAEESGITTGMTLNADLNNPNKGKAAGSALDAEHDVIYYIGEKGEYTFTPETAGCMVSVANPTVKSTMTFSGFTNVRANDDGSYSVPLTQGRNIVKITKNGKAEYQVITAKRVTVTVNNGDPVKPGDKVTVKFDTVFHPNNKIAGLYNYTAYMVYTNVDGYEGKMVAGSGSSYTFASSEKAQTISDFATLGMVGSGMMQKPGATMGAELTIPADYDGNTFTLSGGAIWFGGWGDFAGNHRGITWESGKNANLSAGSPYAYLGKLPDIEIPITVTTSELDNITLETAGVKTAYYSGDTFDTTGLVVTAKYKDNKTQKINNYTVSPEVLTADTEEVTISYNGKTAVIPVDVTPLKVTKIEVTTPPAKTSYEAGERFNPTGMVVTATYNSGKTAAINDYTYAPTGELKESDTQMTITYAGDNGVDNLAVATTPITVTAASSTTPGDNSITVKFTLLGDKYHNSDKDGEIHTLKADNLETWIAEKKVVVPSGSYVIDVVEKALNAAGIPYENPTGNYITEIKGLGEFSNGNTSGWMYTLNGKHPSLGVAEQKVKHGDVIVFHYTDDYTVEESSENWNGGSVDVTDKAVEKVINLINAIGTVDENSGNAIQAAREAYDALSNEQKAMVTNYNVLTAAEKAYAELGESNINFTDVPTGFWAEDAIAFVVENGLFQGTTSTTFEPNTEMSRAMLVTVLWRLDGEPTPTAANTFADVKNGVYYTDAVAWANEKGIVTGYTATQFGSNDNVTREQMATIMYRYAVMKGLDTTVGADTNLLSYKDANQISAYAMDALTWANGAGIITGRTADTLVPQGDSTRAEVATIMMRFVNIYAE